MSDDLPFHHRFDLGRLSQAGAQVAIVARGEELARLAGWAECDAVNGFAASVVLSRISQTRFTLDAQLHADIVQSCVVTLEPVASHIALHIVRDLHYSPHRHPESGELTLSPGDEDMPEEIASLDYDLAAPSWKTSRSPSIPIPARRVSPSTHPRPS